MFMACPDRVVSTRLDWDGFFGEVNAARFQFFFLEKKHEGSEQRRAAGHTNPISCDMYASALT